VHKQIKVFYDMANEYHVAATALWIQIMDAPYLFNPISYLLRHTVELQLKGLIVSELRKDNRNLKINEIKTPAGKMNSVHSVWTLWEFYLKLSQACSIPMDEVDVKFCSNVLSKIDKKDFSSTRLFGSGRNDRHEPGRKSQSQSMTTTKQPRLV